MWKLVRRYYGELCDKEKQEDREVYDEEIVFEHEYCAVAQLEFEKWLQKDIQADYVIDEQQEKIANAAYKLQGKKQYFNKPNDPKTNQIRAGVAVGAYMGTMTTARLIHGGTPITNEYGERNIVGIPFI